MVFDLVYRIMESRVSDRIWISLINEIIVVSIFNRLIYSMLVQLNDISITYHTQRLFQTWIVRLANNLILLLFYLYIIVRSSWIGTTKTMETWNKNCFFLRFDIFWKLVTIFHMVCSYIIFEPTDNYTSDQELLQ